MKKERVKFFVFIALFVLIVIAAVLVLARGRGTGGRLWQYVPEKTKIFLEFDLTEKKLKNYLIQNKEAKDELESFLMDRGLPAEIWDAGLQIQKVAWFQIPIEGTGEGEGWVIQSKNDVGQLSAFLKNFYFKFIDDRVAVITANKDVLTAVDRGPVFSNWEIQTASEAKDNFVCGFWQDDDLMKKSWWSDIWANSFDQNEGELFYGEARVDDQDRIAFFLKTPLVLKKSGVELMVETGAEKERFSQSATFNLRGLKNFWPQILEASGEEEASLEAVEDYLNDKYKIETKELYTIFEQSFNLVVRPKEKVEQIENLWQRNRNDYAIVTKITDKEKRETVAHNWETLIINYLAFKFPERREKILPDKTRGEEIVAVPEKFKLASESTTGGEIKTTKVGDFELGYALAGEKLIIFNSVDLAKQILTKGSKQKDDLKGEIENEGVLDTGIFAMPYFQFANWLSWGAEIDNSRLVVSGWLTN
ncbi:hypothetical protein GYA13_01340 [Candidatus Kuenenbacteria bacterium]|nr:hypothetical protein [Candidatus Kuenenbacteria bacterium]